MAGERRIRKLESWFLLNPPPDSDVEILPWVKPAAPKVRPRDVVCSAIAWMVIVVLATLTAVAQSLPNRGKPASSKKADKDQQSLATLQEAQERVLFRYVIGAGRSGLPGSEQLLSQLNSVKETSTTGWLKYAICAGELEGPESALKELKQLHGQIRKQPSKANVKQRRQLRILQKLYGDYRVLQFTAPSVTKKEREILTDQLGWVGKLALTPPDVELPEDVEAIAGAPAAEALAAMKPADAEKRDEVIGIAKTTFGFIIGFITGGLFLGLFGFVGLVICVVLFFSKKIHSRLFMQRYNGSVYVETFALWMFTFTALSIALPLLFRELSPLVIGAIIPFASLFLSLPWPVIRGISWGTYCQEIGLTLGKRPWLEILMGPVGYAMCLPIAFVGMLISLLLFTAFDRSRLMWFMTANAVPDKPLHPIQPYLANADIGTLMLILFLASVAAPIVEEIMFRGVLYRHLRGLTNGMRLVASVLVSSAVLSFLFAAIHPQGLFAIPALMSLAFGFTLLREWRGTLVPAIIAHGINNGVIMMLFFVLFRM